MNTRDISPFLRNVLQIDFIPMQEYGIAGDCHFFLMDTECILHIEGERHVLSRDAAIIIPAGVAYYFECREPIRMIGINFDYTESARHITSPRPPRQPWIFSEDQITERPDFEDHRFLNRPMIVENALQLRSQVEDILREFECKKLFYGDIVSAMFKMVIFELMRITIQGVKGSRTVDMALEYIHSHYSENIDNESVAHHVGYHSYHLNRLIKTATGTTLRQYIIKHRISVAKRYLEQTELSVFDISELCGYKNFSNFSVDFKKKTGMSPSVYRAKCSKTV